MKNTIKFDEEGMWIPSIINKVIDHSAKEIRRNQEFDYELIKGTPKLSQLDRVYNYIQKKYGD